MKVLICPDRMGITHVLVACGKIADGSTDVPQIRNNVYARGTDYRLEEAQKVDFIARIVPDKPKEIRPFESLSFLKPTERIGSKQVGMYNCEARLTQGVSI